MPEGSLIIIGLFVGYFFLHSLTASLWLKQRVAAHLPALMPYYRLLFNALALLLAIPLIIAIALYPGAPLWQWQGAGFFIANALALLALIAFFYSLKMYDMQTFWGLRQWRERIDTVHDMEPLTLSEFHRYVRHPWYSIILVILWTRDIGTTQLLSYGLITLYLVIGSWLEEQKLIAYHGDVYRQYCRRVPGLLPLPWRYLSRAAAQQLMRQANKMHNRSPS